jgi:crotonobetaine/carnitine-CoA ligase
MPQQRGTDHAYFTVGDLISRQAKARGRKIAIVSDDGSLSYGELDKVTAALADLFRSRGIGADSVVLLMLDNHVDYVLAWVALARIGAIEVPVNTAYFGDILRHVVHSSEATILVAETGYLDRFDSAVVGGSKLSAVLVRGAAPSGSRTEGLQYRRIRFPSAEAEVAAGDLPRAAHETDFKKIMAVMYTSGTTGASKGVMCTHAHALEYSRCVVEVLDLKPGDRYYNVLPLFHIAGQWAAVFACLIAGATVVLKPRFSLSSFWADIRALKCNVTLLLGAMANLVYRAAPVANEEKHPLDKVLVVPLFPEVRQFERRFGVRVTTNYGSTEAGVPLRAGFNQRHPRLFHLANARSCGRPVTDRFELRIVDENDDDVPVGVAGELIVRPKVPWIVMAGYLNQPQKTVETWRNLWLHTGDMLLRDRAGNFYFVDRLKDAIRRRGENISSIEVENAILKFPKVLECAVYPIPSAFTEQEVMAAVVPKAGEKIDEQELAGFLERSLPRFMIPRFYRVEQALPKTPTGKIQKFPLREQGLSVPHWDRHPTEEK